MIKVAFSFKSQEAEEIELFSLGTDRDRRLYKSRYESLITVDYKYKEILLFVFLDVKLWLKEGDY